MLKELTQEQLQLADSVAEQYIGWLTNPEPFNIEKVKPWLAVVYKMYKRETPDRIEVVDSPQAALKLATELVDGHVTQTWTDNCGLVDAGWVATYDFYHRIKQLTDLEADSVLKLRDFMACAWDTVLLDECAIVIRRPKTIKLDDVGQLHCATGPCIEWNDGHPEWAWHGVWVDERIIMNPKSYTLEEYSAITNTEVRRALSESAGWDWVIALLGAETINTWTDPKLKLEYELMRATNGQKFLRKESPPLKRGSQPRYIEPVNRDLVTAQAARKWQALRNLTAQDCERDPVLEYEFEA